MLCQVGVNKATELALQHDLKLVPVHHMEAHALVARSAATVAFPFLCLLVSGGHNMLLVAHGIGDYTLMGSTLDDSVGKCHILMLTACNVAGYCLSLVLAEQVPGTVYT